MRDRDLSSIERVAVEDSPRTNNEDFCDGVPDLHAAKRIPIQDVADRLSLERRGTMIRCWRPDNHQHGDRTPSVGIWRKKNRVKCFVCDAKALSTVDLVQSALGCSTFDAVLWLDAQFSLPRVPKGRHLSRRSSCSWTGRVGMNGRLEALVRSGLWAELEGSEKSLLVVLDAFADSAMHTCTLSYAALKRYAGIATDTTVSKAIKGVEKIHAIEVTRGLGGRGVARCSRYTLTLEHPEFLRLVNECYSTTQEEVAVERRLRAERRGNLVYASKGALHTTPSPTPSQ